MKRIVTIFFLLSLFSVLSVPTQLFTATRGIKVTVKTPQGKNIDLYKDSYALVIGNGRYKKGWDPLPGAIRDAREVVAAIRREGPSSGRHRVIRGGSWVEVARECRSANRHCEVPYVPSYGKIVSIGFRLAMTLD
jgi:hypothetical protein